MHRTPERRNITAIAMSLSEHTGRAKMALALSEAQKVLRQGGLSNVAAYEEISELLSAAAPRARVATSRAADSLFEESWEHQRKMAEQYAQGQAVGPNFPWQNLNALVPFLSPGDMTLIGAQTGFGKSVCAQQISEHIAHTIGGYDVGLFHLETTGLDFMMRLGCRLLPIHGSDYFKTKLTGQKIAKRIERLEGEYRRAQKEKGEITYEASYGIGWEDFKNRVTLGKIRAEAAGKRYVCIVDYYQKFGSSGFSNRTEAYNTIAENLKDLAQQLGIYMIVFSQEQPHTQKSAPGGDVSEGELSSWGGNVINFQSQVIIRVIRRRNIEADSIWMEADDKTPKRDALGKMMYLHRKGQIDSSSKLKVIKASFGQVGDAHVLFANGFFDIMDTDVTSVDFSNR